MGVWNCSVSVEELEHGHGNVDNRGASRCLALLCADDESVQRLRPETDESARTDRILRP